VSEVAGRAKPHLLGSVHHHSRRELMVERERRRILFDFLRSLEDDKHLLETEVMGEAQLHKLSFSETRSRGRLGFKPRFRRSKKEERAEVQQGT
jgi:hypothetical protein